MRSINFLKIKFETELKIIESKVVEMKKIYGFAQIDETLNNWLEKIIPNVIITEDEDFIIVNNNETEFKLRTIMISNAWQQNPNYNEFQINSFSSIETLRSAVYHFILSVSSSGIKVILKREK